MKLSVGLILLATAGGTLAKLADVLHLYDSSLPMEDVEDAFRAEGAHMIHIDTDGCEECLPMAGCHDYWVDGDVYEELKRNDFKVDKLALKKRNIDSPYDIIEGGGYIGGSREVEQYILYGMKLPAYNCIVSIEGNLPVEEIADGKTDNCCKECSPSAILTVNSPRRHS